MKAKKEGPKVDVSRGLPSVNETRRKSNWKGIMLFVVLVLAIGGGAAYWVWIKVKGATQNMTKVEKREEQKPAVKARVFGPPATSPAPGEEAPSGEAGVGATAARPGTTVPNPVAPDAPPVPPALPKAGAAPAEAVPAIAVVGNGPAKPAPLRTHAGNANADGVSASQLRGNRDAGGGKPADDRSRYDTPFVVNGAVQPGGRGGATSQLDDAIRKGNEAIAAATAGQRMPAFSGGGGGEGGKGALAGMLTPTSTPMVRAGMLGNLSLTVKKGTPIECVLSTRIVAEKPGLVRCRLTSPVYSANGKVILADRGSEAIGESTGALRQGDTRLFVLWTEITTPDGVTVPIDSPGTDALGAAGLDGEVNNRWGQRIGAALLLSVIDDAFAYQTAKAGAASSSGSTAVVPYQNTQQQGQRIAEKVLDSTINIPPTLTKNQGDKISIIVARHLDFSSVYALEAK